jgi:hypothetical protein
MNSRECENHNIVLTKIISLVIQHGRPTLKINFTSPPFMYHSLFNFYSLPSHRIVGKQNCYELHEYNSLIQFFPCEAFIKLKYHSYFNQNALVHFCSYQTYRDYFKIRLCHVKKLWLFNIYTKIPVFPNRK